MKNIFLNFLTSFWQLTTHIIFAKKAKVLFYYPQHFNRTAQATNPFFDRLLETCDRHGISYKLIEEPDWGTDKPRNPKAIKGDFLFVLITLIRKLVGCCGVKDSTKRERITARIVNAFTLGRLQYPQYITISGSMLIVFLYLNRHAIVYDMQHGVLYKQHPTFFDEHEHLRPYVANELRWHWLMWGEGYKKCFCRGEEDVLKGRVHVVGYPIAAAKNTIVEENEKIVLFSFQFTYDWNDKQLQEAKYVTDEALQQLAGKNVRVLLKHHPRYNNSISIDDLLQKYPFAELTTLSMQELMPITMLQVTINSTTAFEYAEQGIPSYFIDQNARVKRGNLFYYEYQYPLYQGMSLGEVVERLSVDSLREQDTKVVGQWYREFYDEYNEQEFLKLFAHK